MRRDQPTPQDPDVEASRAELDALEGHKAKAQAGVLTLAENKNRLESDYDERKREIEDELLVSRREADIEKEHLHDEVSAILSAKEKLEHRGSELRNENAALGEANGKLREDVRQSEMKKGEVFGIVAELQKQERELRALVTALEPQVDGLTHRKQTLERDITRLEISKVNTTRDLAEVRDEDNRARIDHHAWLTTRKNERETIMKELSEMRAEVEKLITLRDEVRALEAKAEKINADCDERESGANERMANATKLEQHVQEKLESLKALESQFTTEHLARFGYRKTE